MLSVRLPEDIEQRLAKLAADTGRTKMYYVKQAMQQYIDEMQEHYIAIDRLEKPAKRWSLDDLENDIDLDD